MERIIIIGSCGAGKSTLARQLGALLGVEAIHLDAHYWNAGWVETPGGLWQEKLQQLLAGERWIVDGNYKNTLPLRVAAADTIIFLDLPRALCLWRVLVRRVRFHGRSRPDMAPGCPERVNWSFLLWIWSYPRTQRPGVLRLLAEQEGQKRIVHLRSPAEVRRFLQNPRAR